MLIPYVTALWPSEQECAALVRLFDELGDMIELGVPTSNPKYDGPTIRKTHFEVSRRGLDAIEQLLSLVKPSRDVVLLCYYEDFRNRLPELFDLASRHGIRTVLFPDLLFDFYEETQVYIQMCRKYGLEPSFFISTKFPHKLAEKLEEYEPCFIYLGIQAATGIELPLYVERNVRIFRQIIRKTRLIVGFAISRTSQVEKLLALGVDGIVIGSELVRRYLRGGIDEVRKFLTEIREVINGRKT